MSWGQYGATLVRKTTVGWLDLRKHHQEFHCLLAVFYNYVLIKFIYSDLIRHINDPEHPLTLEELQVVRKDLIRVDSEDSYVNVRYTPTISHCSMATLIGLCIKVRLIQALPRRYKVSFLILVLC